VIGRRHPYYPHLLSMLEAARLARGIHLYYLEKGFTQGTKSGPTDLVTQADRESEEAIKELLPKPLPRGGLPGRGGRERGQ
jgi:Archaeal fructose-1,6-bisphosphatase and related enzymes of inositol monophosphatase family